MLIRVNDHPASSYVFTGTDPLPCDSTHLSPVTAWAVTVFAIVSMLWCCTFSPLFDARMTDSPLNINFRMSSLGTITVPDLAFVAMMMAALIGSRLKNLDRLDLIAIATGGWILIAGLVNVFVNETLDFARFTSYTVHLAPYWFAVPLLRRLPSKHQKYVLTAGVMFAVLVSVIHVYITLAKNVPLLLRLYYAWWDLGSAGNLQIQYTLATQPNAFVRAVPDGMALITSVYVACLAGLGSGKKHVFAWSALATVCGIAALVTLERSLAMVLLVLMPILAFIRYRSTRVSARLFLIPLLAATAFAAVAALSGYDLTSEYLERFTRFSRELDPMSSERLLDTFQSVREVAESPVFGTGLTNPRDYYTDTGADTHGLIMLGLVGGVPLMILTLLAVYHSVRMGLRRRTWQASAGVFIVVHVVAIMAINTFPGFVWTRSLIPTVIGMAMATSLSDGQRSPRRFAFTA